jgi:hypothetical protein
VGQESGIRFALLNRDRARPATSHKNDERDD